MYLFDYIQNTKLKQNIESEQKLDKLYNEIEIDDNIILVPLDNGETKRYKKVYK